MRAGTKAKPRKDGSLPTVDIAIPLFGYQNHISIDRGFGFIRKWAASDAAAYAGRLLRHGLLDKTNTAGGVWDDTGYRSQKNEKFIARNGFAGSVQMLSHIFFMRQRLRFRIVRPDREAACSCSASLTIVFPRCAGAWQRPG